MTPVVVIIIIIAASLATLAGFGLQVASFVKAHPTRCSACRKRSAPDRGVRNICAESHGKAGGETQFDSDGSSR